MKLPHIGWPYQLGQTIEQDTFEQTQADAAVILCTPRGDRLDVPNFGVTSPIFETVPLDVEPLAAELLESDPMLAAQVTDVTDLVRSTVGRLNIDLTERP